MFIQFCIHSILNIYSHTDIHLYHVVESAFLVIVFGCTGAVVITDEKSIYWGSTHIDNNFTEVNNTYPECYHIEAVKYFACECIDGLHGISAEYDLKGAYNYVFTGELYWLYFFLLILPLIFQFLR